MHKLTPVQIAKMIDHSILHPTFTDRDLEANCAIAVKYDVATVCVKPYHVHQAAALLKGSAVEVCAVIGFPHGNSTSEIKVAETIGVIADGAKEVDMVVNIGKVLQGDWAYVEAEIHAINEATVQGGAILKVIFETDFVTRDEDKARLCRICSRQKVAFVKTSTGYGFVRNNDGTYHYQGATERDLRLMREHCDPGVQIKAAGGVRNLEQILHVRSLGVTRVGATATETIMEAAFRQLIS